MNRSHLQTIVQAHLDDARALIDPGAARWWVAFYLSGYAVERALKSCTLSHIERTGVIFSDPKFITAPTKFMMHKLEELVTQAGFTKDVKQKCNSVPEFAFHWQLDIRWNETSRYHEKTRSEAEGLNEPIDWSKDKKGDEKHATVLILPEVQPAFA